MPSIYDKTTGIDETEISNSSSLSRQSISLSRIREYALLSIAVLMAGALAYQRYPRTIENATIMSDINTYTNSYVRQI